MADGSVLIDAKLNTSPVEKGLASMKKLFSGSGIAKAGKAAFTGITTAVTAAGAALTAMGGFAVKTGMEFDTAMSQVAATMGKSVDEIGAMRDAAIQYGASTAFSATEAAEALNYLALAGYDAEKAVDVLPSVLDLAAAGSMDLAYASDLVTDAMAALGVEATSENVTAFGDKMAKTASKANTSVAQLGEAILTVGGTAKSLAGGTSELNTALGVLANRGIKGSEGGTALRNVIMSLTAPTDIARKAMKKLGIQIEDTETGKMRPLNEIMADFNKKTEGMSVAAKNDYLSKIFNKTDLAAVQALMAGCGEEWDLLYEAIENADGAMSDMAKTQLDNLEGDVENLTGALESLGIAAYDKVKEPMREIVQLGEEMIVKLTNAMTEEGFTGFASALGGVLADGITTLTGYLPQMVTMGADVIKSLVQGISDNSDQIATSAADALGVIATAVIELLPDLTVAAAKLILSFAQRIPNLLTLVVSAVKNVDWAGCGKQVLDLIIGAFSGWTDTAGDIGTFAKTILTSLTTGITGSGSGDIATSISSLISGISQDDISTAVSSLAKVVFDGLVAGISAITTGASSIAGAISGFLSGLNKADFGTSIGTTATAVLDALFDAIAVSTTTPDMSSLVTNIGTGIKESISFLGDIAGEIAGYITSPEGLNSIMQAGAGLATMLFAGITSAIHGLLSGLGDALSSVFSAIGNNLLELIGLDPAEVKANVDSFFDSLQTETGRAIGEMTEDQMKAYGFQLTNGMGTVLEQAKAWVALEAAGYGDVFGQYAEASFNTAGVALAAALEAGFNGNTEQQTQAMAALMVNGMGSGLKEAYPELAQAARELIGDGFEPSLEEACAALNIPIPSTIAEALGAHGEVAQMAGDSINAGGDSALAGAAKFAQAGEELAGADTTAADIADSVGESSSEIQTSTSEIVTAAENAATAQENAEAAQAAVATATEGIATDTGAAVTTVEGAAGSVTTTIETMATDVSTALENAAPAATTAGEAVVQGFVDGITKKAVESTFTTCATSVYTALNTAIGTAFGSGDGGSATKFSPAGEGVITAITEGITNKAVEGTFSACAGSACTALQTALNSAFGSSDGSSAIKFKYIGEGVVQGVVDGINAKAVHSTFSAAAGRVASAVKSALESACSKSTWAYIGAMICEGVASGISSNSGKIASAARDAARKAYNAAKSELGINSPSKSFAELGMYCMEGLVVGIEDNSDDFINAYRHVLDNAKRYAADSDILNAAADRMRLAFDAQTSVGDDGDDPKRGGIDYTELARAVWEEMPEDFAINQTVNFNQPVKTPDETARELRYNNTQGLVGGNH